MLSVLFLSTFSFVIEGRTSAHIWKYCCCMACTELLPYGILAGGELSVSLSEVMLMRQNVLYWRHADVECGRPITRTDRNNTHAVGVALQSIYTMHTSLILDKHARRMQL